MRTDCGRCWCLAVFSVDVLGSLCRRDVQAVDVVVLAEGFGEGEDGVNLASLLGHEAVSWEAFKLRLSHDQAGIDLILVYIVRALVDHDKFPPHDLIRALEDLAPSLVIEIVVSPSSSSSLSSLSRSSRRSEGEDSGRRNS